MEQTERCIRMDQILENKRMSFGLNYDWVRDTEKYRVLFLSDIASSVVHLIEECESPYEAEMARRAIEAGRAWAYGKVGAGEFETAIHKFWKSVNVFALSSVRFPYTQLHTGPCAVACVWASFPNTHYRGNFLRCSQFSVMAVSCRFIDPEYVEIQDRQWRFIEEKLLKWENWNRLGVEE